MSPTNHTVPDLTVAGANEAAPTPTNEPGWKPSVHELLVMATLSVIMLMVALDACIVVTSLSTFVTALHGDATQGFWVGTSYLLASAVTMPFTAAASDIFGRPICLVVSLAMFTIGSGLCAAAQDMGVLLAGRSVQGVGGGAIMVISMITFTDIVPLRFRPKWYGTIMGSWALGNCLGPILGGIFAQKTTWRWVFYIMFPFCGIGLICVPLLLTLKPKVATVADKLARIDWIGGFLFMSSATSFLIAISWGGTQFAWNSVQTILPLILGVVGLAGTFVWEGYFAKEPFLRHRLFWGLSPIVTYICGGIQGLVLIGQLYYVPFYFLTVKGFTPIQTGLALLPVMLTFVPGSIITGVLVTRYNNYRYAIWVGWTLTTVGCGLTVLWSSNTSAAVWAPTLVVLGIGHGTILNAQNFATQAMCGRGDDQGASAAMYGFARQFGTALGVGVGGSAFQNAMALKLGWEGLDTSLAQNADAVSVELGTLPDGAFKTALLDGYKWGFMGVFAVYVGISGVAFFISLVIRHFDMNKKIDTEHKLHENSVSKLFEARVGQAVLAQSSGSSDVEARVKEKKTTRSVG